MKNWLIVFFYSDCGTHYYCNFKGTKDEVKEEIIKYISLDIINSNDVVDYATTNVDELEERLDGSIVSGLAIFLNSQIYYEAVNAEYILNN